MNLLTAPAAAIDLAPLDNSFAGQVLRRLQATVDPLVLVGGSVRDLLLGRELHDIDLAVPAGGLQQARQVADAMRGSFVPLDAERDTGRAVLSSPHGQRLVVDVAAWRGPSLADDLRLRDFTVNALAAELRGSSALIIDVTGGLDDLAARLLRVTSPQALPDDPLRCLRAVRLLAELSPWGFRLEHDTVRQIRRHASLVTASAGERVRDELVRTLAADQPQRWVSELDNLGLLAVLLPEAAAQHNIPQTAPHVYDVFEHTLHTLEHSARLAGWICGRDEPADALDETAGQALSPFQPALGQHLRQSSGASLGERSQALRWAALCHDWGKPVTLEMEAVPESGLQRARFLGHEDVSADLTRAALRRLRFSEAEQRWVTAIVAGHMRPHHLVAAGQPSRRAIYRYFRDLGPAGVDTALLSLADLRATAGAGLTMAVWQRQLALVTGLLDAYFNRPQEAVRPAPLLDGHELMAALGLPPGREIGLLLEATAEAQAAGELHSREEALTYAARVAAGLRGHDTIL